MRLGFRHRLVFQALLALAFTLFSAPAYAEEKTTFELPRTSFSKSATTARQARIAGSTAEIKLPLPGARADVRLTLAEKALKPVQLLGSAGSQSAPRVFSVSGERGETGVLVVSASGKTYGTLLDPSTGETALVKIAPEADASSAGDSVLHSAVRYTADEARRNGRLELDLLAAPLLSGDSAAPTQRSTSKEPGFSGSTGAVWRGLQLVAVSPGEFTDGRSDDDVVAQIQEVVAEANLYFERLALTIELAGVQIFQKGADDPYNAASIRQSAFEMLDVLRSQWQDRKAPEHDAIALFGKGEYNSYYGLAYPSTACVDPNFSVVFASQGGTSPSAQLSLPSTLAHELGHFLGMSHDSTLYSDGPSLMWPYDVPLTSGFSDLSVAEYESHAAVGLPGGACLTAIEQPTGADDGGAAPPAGLVFEGGSNQTVAVNEGQTLTRSFALVGRKTGVSYTASGLPAGAVLDALTGDLQYAPDFAVARRSAPVKTFDVTILAKTFSAQASAKVAIVVHDVNRAPVFTAPDGAVIDAEEGTTLNLRISAQDLDEGDRAKLSCRNKSALRRLKGRPKIAVNGGQAVINWRIPIGAAGDYPAVFSAKDLKKAVSSKTVTLHVKRRNLAPAIDAPAEVVQAQDGTVRFAVSAVDPEGQHVSISTKGLPAGTLVAYTSAGAQIQFAAADALPANLSIAIEASDGEKSSIKSVIVHGTAPRSATDASAGVAWPGTAFLRSHPPINYSGDGQAEVPFYDPDSGQWAVTSCSGDLKSVQQFGGFFGDQPVRFKIAQRYVRAVYRLINGVAFWFIDQPSGAKVVQWGAAEDLAVAGDYDGDLTTDYAVFRPAVGKWFIQLSSGGLQVYDTPAGAIEGLVVPFAADLDGDGKDDRIIFTRGEDGRAAYEVVTALSEHFLFVINAYRKVDKIQPVVGDFDGDGRSDLAVKEGGGILRVFLSGSGIVKTFDSQLSYSPQWAETNCGGTAAAELLLDPLHAAAVAISANSKSPFSPLNLQRFGDFETLESAQLRAAYRRTTAVPGDINGDRKTDAVVFRPSDGFSSKWLTLTGAGQIEERPAAAAAFGYPVSGVFTGPARKQQLAFFSAGKWTVAGEQPGDSSRTYYWGEAGDVPVPGDYNGDGLTEFAVYRPTTSTWWILYPNADAAPEMLAQRWGEAGDVPVPADYDGDGSTDLGIWRPAEGTFYVLLNGSSIMLTSLGSEGDIPAVGDFNGDGKADFAIWRPADGYWFAQTGHELVFRQWGLSEDNPIIGDFDGSGHSDFAVYRPSQGTWYVRVPGVSSDTSLQYNLGLSADLPLGGLRLLRLF